MSRTTAPSAVSPDLIEEIAALARDLRRSFCAMLQDEIDRLAADIIEIDTLCRDLRDADVVVRLAGVSDSLEGLRTEKVALAARLGCIPVAGITG